jgi:hypothetical protein
MTPGRGGFGGGPLFRILGQKNKHDDNQENYSEPANNTFDESVDGAGMAGHGQQDQHQQNDD